MATLVKQLQTKAAHASQVISKHGTEYYKQLLAKNKQYVVGEASVEKCQELSKQLFYTRLASIPGRYKAFWEEVDYVKQKFLKREELKLEEIGIGVLFAGECYAWFCVGEIVGRGGTITGYKV
ncbi:unnamed protein product [Calypogeia fissa]